MRQDRVLKRHREDVRIRDRQAAVVRESADFAIAGEVRRFARTGLDAAFEPGHDLPVRHECAARPNTALGK